MRISWLVIMRRLHAFLSIFFTPLLLLFILTGAWQMMVPEEEREKPGMIRKLAEDLSTVHTDGYFPKAGAVDPSTAGFKFLTAGLCVALVVSIVLGLVLAWNSPRNRWWSVVALVLGVLVPALILWLA